MTLQRNYREIRHAELEAVRPLLKPGAAVLEIGGGDGWQASLLSGWGYKVVSIDIAPAADGPGYFPVSRYDGRTIPARDGQFDVVFSSNVLEHVEDLAGLLAETRRVLKPGGLALHIMPSVRWRFWTLAFHYPVLVKLAAQNLRCALGGGTGRPDVDLREKVSQRSWKRLLRYAIGISPHGHFASSIEELRAYRAKVWERKIAAAGFERVLAFGSGVFYTGAWFVAPLRWRYRLARVFGSTCNVYAARIAAPEAA